MKKQVCAYLHTHWDREWYRDKEDFNLRLLDVMDIVLKELKEKQAECIRLKNEIIHLKCQIKQNQPDLS